MPNFLKTIPQLADFISIEILINARAPSDRVLAKTNTTQTLKDPVNQK